MGLIKQIKRYKTLNTDAVIIPGVGSPNFNRCMAMETSFLKITLSKQKQHSHIQRGVY